MEKYEIYYSCETKDGGTGFGCDSIVCTNEIDCKAIFDFIVAHPENFDFAPVDKGQKRLVSALDKTVYLD